MVFFINFSVTVTVLGMYANNFDNLIHFQDNPSKRSNMIISRSWRMGTLSTTTANDQARYSSFSDLVTIRLKILAFII